MKQPVEFLEQLVGTTGRFVPAGCSDRLFRKTRNFLMEQAVEKSEQLVVLFWPIVPRGIFGRIIKRSKLEQPIAQISENGNENISEIEMNNWNDGIVSKYFFKPLFSLHDS